MEHFSEHLVEKLDSLPHAEGYRNGKCYRHMNNFPWRKARRWIETKIGQNFDDVFSDWVKLEWIPEVYHNQRGIFYTLDRVIEYTPDRIISKWGRDLKWSGGIILNPNTNLIERIVPTPRESYHQMQERLRDEYFRFIAPGHQLLKEGGIWYEVKFEVPDSALLGYGSVYGKRIADKNWQSYKESLLKSPVSKAYIKILSKHQLNSKELKQHNLSND